MPRGGRQLGVLRTRKRSVWLVHREVERDEARDVEQAPDLPEPESSN